MGGLILNTGREAAADDGTTDALLRTREPVRVVEAVELTVLPTDDVGDGGDTGDDSDEADDSARLVRLAESTSCALLRLVSGLRATDEGDG